MLFYTLPTLDVSEVFAPQMEEIYFPAGSSITERRYSITPGHAEFIRELLLETNWAGGLFNVASANVTTNLSNGALGFFGLCAVTQLSVIVNPSLAVLKKTKKTGYGIRVPAVSGVLSSGNQNSPLNQ